MLFNSYIFILCFLPITMIGYYGCNHWKKEEAAKWFLIIASLLFYGYFDVRYLPVILASICFNYGFSRMLLKKKTNKRMLLGAGIFCNAGLLFYIKYWNFFWENVNAVFGSSLELKQLLMPLGISFFTFQQIAYLVDSYRGETVKYSFTDYTLFVAFFPKLSMGPIVLHHQLIPEFHKKENKVLNQTRLSLGIWWFTIGLSKKVLLADTLAKGVDFAYANVEALGGLDVVVVAMLYTLQLYFDFSGYCDMACGIGEMFQIRLPRNFNSPYKATSITEFWNRWHMTLSGFLQKYIYFPLGGSRKGMIRSIVNILIVFLISGIWHGAAWTYIVWGLLHGVARVLHKIFQKTWDKFPKAIRWFTTFVFLNVTWIFFRAESLTQAWKMLKKVFTAFEWKLNSGLMQQFDVLEFTYIEEHVAPFMSVVKTYPYIHLLMVMLIGLFVALVPKNLYEKEFKPGMGNALISVVLLVWCILSFSGVSTFLYFNF